MAARAPVRARPRDWSAPAPPASPTATAPPRSSVSAPPPPPAPAASPTSPGSPATPPSPAQTPPSSAQRGRVGVGVSAHSPAGHGVDRSVSTPPLGEGRFTTESTEYPEAQRERVNPPYPDAPSAMNDSRAAAGRASNPVTHLATSFARRLASSVSSVLSVVQLAGAHAALASTNSSLLRAAGEGWGGGLSAHSPAGHGLDRSVSPALLDRAHDSNAVDSAAALPHKLTRPSGKRRAAMG
jgi:hypothetical protein